MKIRWLALPFLVALACSSSTPPASSDITSVTVVAPGQVTGGLRFKVQATVQGTASDKTVRWSVEGGGTFVDASANPALYVAPLVASPATIRVKAQATGDASKTGIAAIQVVPAAPLVATVNPALKPAQPSLPDRQGVPVALAASRDAAGVRTDFLVGQVLVRPAAGNNLADFLQRYQGTVIDDDTVPEPPASLGITLSAAQRQARVYLVRINLAGVNVATFATDAAAIGLGGALEFSSDDGLRSAAVVTNAAAAGFDATPNRVERPDAFPSVLLSTHETSDGKGGNIDAFTATPNWQRFWTTGSQSNVTLAWQFLSARGIVRRVRIAIIDGGFWLDTNGKPRGTDSDLPPNPIQYDFDGDRDVADGPNPNNCTNNSSCYWHGNHSAGVAMGFLDNRQGAAGTGGQVADPMLMKFNGSLGQRNRAIRTAAAWGADVVSMSFGGDCNLYCRILDRIATPIDDAVSDGSKAVFIAAAGNGDSDGNGYDVGDPHFVHPCLEDHVLCIGALKDDALTQKQYSNFGGRVGLFAPTDVPVMPTPGPADNNADGPLVTGQTHGGTSAATPFVAGVAAMVKAIAPDLDGDQVVQLLVNTAHVGTSPVDRYIDAYAAVKKAAEGIAGVHDGFEPNQSEGTARALLPGSYPGLNLETDGDLDFFRLSFARPAEIKIDLAFMSSLGAVTIGDGYGLDADQVGCGSFLQEAWRPTTNALSTSYIVPAGNYLMKISGRINAYDLTWSSQDAFIFPVNPDGYEPNNSLGSATNLGKGGAGTATITPGDVDVYRFESPGSITNRFLTTSAGFGIRSTDVPLTLTLYDRLGIVVGGPVSNDATCGSNPKFEKLPPGTFYVVVAASASGGKGNYAFGAGVSAKGGDGPVRDRVYQRLHPGDPVEGIFRDRFDGYMFTHTPLVAAIDVFAQEELALSLLDLDGNVLTQGPSTYNGQGYFSQLSLAGAVPGTDYLVEITRANAAVATAPPNVPAVTFQMSWEQPQATDSFNLIWNGNADDGNQVSSPSGDVVDRIVGWVRPADSTVTVVNYLTSGGGFPTTTDPGPPDRGPHLFVGGPGSASSSINQTIDLASALEAPAGWLTAIDAGRVAARLSGYLGGFVSQNDGASLTATFYDANEQILATMSLDPPVTAAERNQATGMVFRLTDGSVPVGTRQVQLHLEFIRTDGTYNDGYADSLSFSLQSVGP